METIAQRLRRAFADHRGRVAAVDTAGAQLTFDEVDEAGARVAAFLRGGGVAGGDRVAIMLPNSLATVIGYVGIWKAGGVPVPINPAYTLPELEAVMSHSRPTAALVTAGKVAELGRLPEETRGRLRAVLSDGPAAVPALSSLPAASERWPGGEGGDEALLSYSSGTTGQPKGIMTGHAAAIWGQDACRKSHAITADDVMLAVTPLFHMHGLLLHLLQSLITGNRLVVVSGMEAPKLLRIIADHRVTVWKAVPALLDAILAIRWEPGLYDVSSLRLLTSGTAPSSQASIQRALERLGQPTFREAYGASEVSGLVCFGPLSRPYRPGCVGMPVEDVTVQIRDPEGGVLPPGQQGEIWVQSSGLMMGYFQDEAATARVIRNGWYRSSDVGFLDDDGYLHVVDRLSSVIFVGGINVYPREIEDALRTYDAIAAAAVVAMPHPATGEAPLAYVVPREGRSIEVPELLAHLKTRLAPHKIPRRIEVVADLPRGSLGKVQKHKLGPK
jgi:long-chain acyl-CoA synthetase